MAREEEREGLEHTGYRSGQIRIIGAEPAGRSAALRAEETAAEPWDEEPEEEATGEGARVTPPLPHWTEPATGEVPAILARELEDHDDPFSSLSGPTWREETSDWEAQDEEFEPSMLAGDQTGQGSLDSTADRQPWVFDLPGAPETGGTELFGDEEGWDDASDWDELGLGGSVATWSGAEEEDGEGAEGGPVTEVLPAVGAHAEPDGEPEEDEVSKGVLSAPPVAEVPGGGFLEDLAAPVEGGFLAEGLSDTIEEPHSRFFPRLHRHRDAEPGHEPAAREHGHREARRTPTRERRTGPATPTAARLRPPAPPQTGEPAPRNVAAAIVSGLVIGGLALVTFKIGPVAAVSLVTVIVTMAAAEAFAAFRHGGYHPVTLLGLVGTISLMVATYNRGVAALPLVFVLLVAACFVWHLAGVESTDTVRSIGTTLFVFGWVAVFGSFGALLLSPALFPHRHGIAFLLGGLIAAVSYDVGALAFGAWLGRHPLASVSPHKTWEGFVGGLVTSLILSVVIIHLIHPWTVGKAAALALVVSVVATLGDLFESTVKRHLGRKDMGRLLPGHGGLLDRVDGLLFALPATYYLVLAFHLG